MAAPTALTPHDPRWHGPQHFYLPIALLKSLLLVEFCILTTTETIFFHAWHGYKNSVTDNITRFFIRIGIALVPDVLSAPLTYLLFRNYSFHPVFALAQSLVLFGLYISCLVLNVLVVRSNKTAFDRVETWYKLCYAEMAFQGMFALFWVALSVCGCVAVHEWRGMKAGGKVRGAEGEELELLGREEDRKDSGVVDDRE